MKNRTQILILILSLFVAACSSNKQKQTETNDGPKSHKVTTIDVLQANAYTYLYVVEEGREQWIAVPKMQAQIGETYYYDEFLEMNDFKSKDLDRTFESVYFIQDISTQPSAKQTPTMPAGHLGHDKTNTTAQAPNINIEKATNGLSVGELFANKKQYNGEKVVIKGKIVKANYDIMNKNWFHLQDGSSANGAYDLTITSLETEVKVGDILTFEGKITLDKDFGHGYSYDVLMEEAEIIK